MSYSVVTTERVARELDAAAWWAHQHSVEQADRWYQGILAAIAGLATLPERCPIAIEGKFFPTTFANLPRLPLFRWL